MARLYPSFDAALELAQAGIPVFPVNLAYNSQKRKWDKIPAIKAWKESASIKDVDIQDWWSKLPFSVPGMPLGHHNLIAIDLDRHGGPDGIVAFEELERQNEPIPDHPVILTAGGGEHHIFRQPPSKALGNRKGSLPAGIDVRGVDGFIVAQGSMRHDGAYWIPKIDTPSLIESIHANTIPDLPNWIVKLIETQPEVAIPTTSGSISRVTGSSGRWALYAEKALIENCRELSSTISGGRNDALNAISYRMGRMVAQNWIDRSVVEDALWQACMQNGLMKDDGAHAVRSTIKSGLGGGMLKPHEGLKASPADNIIALPNAKQVVKPIDIGLGYYVWQDAGRIQMREWIYGHHLIKKFVSSTIAPGGVGKSSLVIAEALAMVSGKNILGEEQHGQLLNVWLWNLEDPMDELVRRIQATAKRYDMVRTDLEPRLFVTSGRDTPCVIAETKRGDTTIIRQVSDEIIKNLIEKQIDVLIIDPFVSCHQANENDNNAIDMIVKEWARIADAANCAIELVHHTRKMGPDGEVTTESSRGGKAMTDGCRSVRAVNRMTEDEGGKAGVDNHRLYFRTYLDKGNLAPPPDKSDWFMLESICLGNGPTPDTGDQVGVVVPWEWPDAFEGITVHDLKKVQHRIANGDWREDVRSTTWAGIAVAAALGLDLEKKGVKERVKKLINTWLVSGVLIAVDRRDVDSKLRKFIEVPQ